MLDMTNRQDPNERIAAERIAAHLRIGGKTVIVHGQIACILGTCIMPRTGDRAVRMLDLARGIEFVMRLDACAGLRFPGVA